MFTGLITHLGTISAAEPAPTGMRLRIDTSMADGSLVDGESIAVDGCCLTVVSHAAGRFETQLSHETLDRTTLGDLCTGTVVNLERALRLGDRLGGHWVQGHVDGVGQVTAVRRLDEMHEADIQVPPELGKYIVSKGSLTVAGVSLTVNRIADAAVALTLIPHTWNHTTFQYFQAGTRVNLEVDILAKYVESLAAHGAKTG
jgi:riboflavin synthase